MALANVSPAQTSAPAATVSDRRKLGNLEVSTIGLGVQNMSRTYQTTIPTRSEMHRIIRIAHERGVTLFDASRAHDDIAASMVDMDEPWHGLKANGFPNPHATGLMDHVHAAYVDKIRPNLNMESWLDVLFKWLNPEPGKRKTSGSIEVIEAVLGHWVRKTASD